MQRRRRFMDDYGLAFKEADALTQDAPTGDLLDAAVAAGADAKRCVNLMLSRGAALANERLEKRAEDELGHLPGTAKSRATMLRVVEGIEDEDDRKNAMKALKAGDSAIAKGFDILGTAAVEEALDIEGQSAGSQLDKAVAKYATDHKLDEAEAYSKYLETTEGRQLYAKTQN